MNTHQPHNIYVVAINGASGAGKTSLVNALVQTLNDAVPLYFDDYNPSAVSSSKYPPDTVKWVDDGADPNVWETPQLVQDLQTLREGKPVTLLGNKEILFPKRFIVLEEPFGRERLDMKPLIDAVIAIDVPLEIALARRLLRSLERPEAAEHSDELFNNMRGFLHHYLRIGREFYSAVNEQVQKNCDLILNGMKPIDELAMEATIWIQDHVTDHS